MLLAGPRGRRLCLALAQQLSDELHSAVFDVSYALDPEVGRGVSRSVAISVEDDTSTVARIAAQAQAAAITAELRAEAAALRAAHASGLPPRKDREVAHAARLLESVPLDAVTAHHVDLALREAVDFARYWQQPDGQDVLAARPELRSGLERVARAVLGREDLGWWGEDRAATQFFLQRPDLTAGEEGDSPVVLLPLPDPDGDPHGELRSSAHSTERYESRRDPSRPLRAQSASGAWWSMPQVPWTVGRLPEGAVLAEDGDGTTLVAHPVQDPGRTVEIRTPEDWVELCRRFPLEVTRTRLDDWYRATGRTGRWVIPDWSRAADEFDAVHLSVWGYLTTAGRALPVGEDTATLMAGCSADGTWWLTRVPVPTGSPTCTITYDDEADRWVETAADEAG